METQKNFKQSWNKKIKRYVLIDCSDGIKGGVTGKVSKEPFKDVPIIKDKQQNEHKSQEKQSKNDVEGNPEKEQPEEKDKMVSQAAKLDDEESSSPSDWVW